MQDDLRHLAERSLAGENPAAPSNDLKQARSSKTFLCNTLNSGLTCGYAHVESAITNALHSSLALEVRGVR